MLIITDNQVTLDLDKADEYIPFVFTDSAVLEAKLKKHSLRGVLEPIWTYNGISIGDVVDYAPAGPYADLSNGNTVACFFKWAHREDSELLVLYQEEGFDDVDSLVVRSV